MKSRRPLTETFSSIKEIFSGERRLQASPVTFVLHASFALFALVGCSGSSKSLVSETPLISVAITEAPPPSLNVGGTAQVSASVNHDIANAGVDWVATCGSASLCGTFSPAHTPSGGVTTFVAPLAVPAHNTVAVTALSATDHSKAFAATVTILSTITGVTITQAPPSSVPAGAGVLLAATVVGDPSNEGVDWKFTCGDIDCTPPGFHSDSGAATTFFVPSTAQFGTIVGSTVTATAFATADHNFSASASFIVTGSISISLTQTPPNTLLTNATATVAAVVMNDTTNAGVDWTVSCADAPCGKVSPSHTASGALATFTAPPTVPAPNPNPNPIVVITATSTAAPSSAFVAASVTIVAPISVQITQGVPTNSIVQNTTAALIATVTDDPANAGVDWTVTCGSPSACGGFSPTHTASGVPTTFAAPSAVPVGNTVTITATSTADPTKSAVLTVTVTFGLPPDKLLLGKFVILVSATSAANGPYAFGGFISGDGTGHITDGSVDVADTFGNTASSVPVMPSIYAVGPDGRGQIQLQLGTNASFGVNDSGLVTLSVVFVTPQHALLTETDSFGMGTGTLDLQSTSDLAQFQQMGFKNGTYSFKLTGVEASNSSRSYFVASAISLDFATASYSYISDQSDNGAITSAAFASESLNGHVSPNPSGELTFSSLDLGLPTHFNFDAFFIDLNHYAVLDWRDSFLGSPRIIASGYLTAQPSSPTVSGTYAFTLAGATTGAQIQVAGGILACGSSSGVLDAVSLGGATISNVPVTANCASPDNGRSLLSISGTSTGGIAQFAAYPTLDQGLYLIELDGGANGTSGPSGAGVALLQTLSVPISASALNGAYASRYLASTGVGSQNLAGQVIANGMSTLTGTADVNSFDMTASPPAKPSVGSGLSGSFTESPNGRFPATLTITPSGQPAPQVPTLNAICYIVDANTCLVLGADATAPGTGILLLQNTGL